MCHKYCIQRLAGRVILAGTLFIGGVLLLSAGEPAQFVYWSSADLDGTERKLHLKLDEPGLGASQSLIRLQSQSAILAYREGMPPKAEIHQKVGDFAFIRDGDASVLIGGTVFAAQESTANELR